MLFVAHRGESLDAPENTMAAFALAWNRHCRCIECDVRLTSDGEIVCMHDASTLRTTGVDLEIARTPYSKLWPLDAGAWKDPDWEGEAIPKLSEVLSEMPADGRIYIEIKCSTEILAPLKKVIDDAPVSLWQIRLISFDSEVVTQARKLFSGVKVHQLLTFSSENGELVPDADSLIAKLKELKVVCVGCQAHDDLTADYIKKIMNAGIDVNVWTIDDTDKTKRFVHMGVSSITSNRAAELSNIFYS